MADPKQRPSLGDRLKQLGSRWVEALESLGERLLSPAPVPVPVTAPSPAPRGGRRPPR